MQKQIFFHLCYEFSFVDMIVPRGTLLLFSRHYSFLSYAVCSGFFDMEFDAKCLFDAEFVCCLVDAEIELLLLFRCGYAMSYAWLLYFVGQ